MKRILPLLFWFVAIQASSQNTTKKVITVSPSLSFQNYEHFKRLVLNSPDSHIEFLSDFEFGWGYTYTLEVAETKLATTISDGTQYSYTFEKLLSKTKVSDSTEFILTLDPNRYYYAVDSSEAGMNVTLKPINDSTYLYFEKVEIEVPENLRAAISSLREGNTSKRGVFIYINEKRIRLIRFY